VAARQASDRRDRPAQLAAELVMFRRWRERILPVGLDGEPIWDLLLILYADKDSIRYPIGALSKTAGTSFSGTYRWVHTLKDRGLLDLTIDPRHADQIYVSLTDRGEQLMTSVLHGFESR
jgi:DNA-binding MarR family transcriptional regulator